MILREPVWLILLVPLGAAWWLWRLPGRLLPALRLTATLLLLLALCGMSLRLPSRSGTLVVVADRSRSMPADSEQSQREILDLLHAAMGAEDRLGVVSFGQKSAVEQAPQTGRFGGFTQEVGGDASNLADALEMAAALLPRESPGRLLILSDGKWTGRDPASGLTRLAGRGIPVDFRFTQRLSANDLAIARIDAPTAVAPGESFLITAWVQAPTATTTPFELRRGAQVLSAGQRTLTPGLNRLTFRDRAVTPGTQSYTLVVGGEDSVPENNRARFLVGVQGPKPLLHVSGTKTSGLARLLRGGGLKVEAKLPEECDWSLEGLSQFSAVVLENVPAEKIGMRGMETLSAWVRETGAGLFKTGGRNSYGPGGYYRSPLEAILPVSMELRNEHRKLAIAMVVALDRSGSMAVPVSGGKVKMDLANLGASQVLDLLGPMDEFGCLAVDTAAHTIAPLAQVTDKAPVRSKILRIQSEGGGIYVYVALDAAARMLSKAKAGTKHIILFADAADAEEPGKYKALVDSCQKAGITVSVIGLGSTKDKDAELLRDIAARGRGRCFFTDRPEELPRLFAQDTFTVARNTFLDEPTPIQTTAGLTTLTGRDFKTTQPLGGYNLCYLRPEATLATVTVDEYKAPVVAAWQAGRGRVVCYTGEADGPHAGAMAQWDQIGEYYTSLARWAAGPQGELPHELLLTQEVSRGIHRLTLHLDPDRKVEPFTGLPSVTWLRSRPGEAPEARPGFLDWSGPDTLSLEIPLAGTETALATVEVSGHKPIALAPVCLPYSPEFEPSGDDGLATLERLARATGGQERLDVAGLWRELPVMPRYLSLAPWLALVAVGLILLEVLERRMSGLSRLGRRIGSWTWGRKLATKPKTTKRPISEQPLAKTAPILPRSELAVSEKKEPKTAPAAVEETGGILDALRQVRKKDGPRGK